MQFLFALINSVVSRAICLSALAMIPATSRQEGGEEMVSPNDCPDGGRETKGHSVIELLESVPPRTRESDMY